ncbi:DUF6114 domain-containing protein [Amycolatopsis sp. NPDC051102]|uniref:DUF6114 domain-containing protein n=1 Tax=Amycolatopsis sp. NPDC051102 TaxID=3155163 RepID=UPI00343B8F9E
MSGAHERARRALRDFGHWRRSRPFSAGAFLLLSGVVIMLPPYATFRWGDVLISITTIGGVSALLIGVLLVICGLSLWLRPQFRFAAAVTAMLLSLVAMAVTNLGGFLVGTLAGVIGAALALAWTDQPRAPRGRRRSMLRGLVVLGLIAVAVDVMPVAARDDRTPARSWTLSASTLRLDGVVYHGIDRITVDGRLTRTMRFTVERIEATDPVQVGELGNGHELVTAARRGGVATASGRIELFAMRVTGVVTLLGLVGIPVDFTPDHPPPLVPPSVVLTDATTVNAQARGGAIVIPNARLTIR